MVLEKPITEKIMKYKRSKSGKTIISKKQVGVIVAGYDAEKSDDILIGYSLCHHNDKFDWIPIPDRRPVHVRGFNKYIASERAFKWNKHNFNEVPPSIHKQLSLFIKRCVKYYKGKTLPHWAFILSKQS